MTKRKTRPKRGAAITEDMSLRDVAAALGMSTGQLHRWKKLSDIPEVEFEARLDRQMRDWSDGGKRVTTESILRGAPVPARRRVDRALALVRGMTDSELAEFLAELARVLGATANGERR